MASPRVGWWALGMVAGAALAATVPEDLFPGARPVTFGAAFLAIGLLGEVARGRSSRARRPSWPPRDGREADGRVDVARVSGVRRAVNPASPRFGAFRGLLDAPAGLIGNGRDVSDPGRNPALLGRVVVVSLFVGKDGRRWKAAEVAGAHEAMLRAGGWVEREAIRYRAAVNVELADTYFLFDDDAPDEVAVGFAGEGHDVGPFEEGAAVKALVTATRAAVALGFRDAGELSRTVADRVDADATVWLMHPRCSGRSFAVPPEDSLLSGVSLAVCYPEESSFPERLIGPARPDPVTVVHELLHLFGATDKYGRALREYAPRTVSGRDVMRLDETRLDRLRVDPRTAAEVGWVS